MQKPIPPEILKENALQTSKAKKFFIREVMSFILEDLEFQTRLLPLLSKALYEKDGEDSFEFLDNFLIDFTADCLVQASSNLTEAEENAYRLADDYKEEYSFANILFCGLSDQLLFWIYKDILNENSEPKERTWKLLEGYIYQTFIPSLILKHNRMRLCLWASRSTKTSEEDTNFVQNIVDLYIDVTESIGRYDKLDSRLRYTLINQPKRIAYPKFIPPMSYEIEAKKVVDTIELFADSEADSKKFIRTAKHIIAPYFYSDIILRKKVFEQGEEEYISYFYDKLGYKNSMPYFLPLLIDALNKYEAYADPEDENFVCTVEEFQCFSLKESVYNKICGLICNLLKYNRGYFRNEGLIKEKLILAVASLYRKDEVTNCIYDEVLKLFPKDWRSSDGNDLFMIAVLYKNQELIDKILETGFEISTDIKNNAGNDLLMIAILQRDNDLIEKLIDLGAEVNKEHTDKIIEIQKKKRSNIYDEDIFGIRFTGIPKKEKSLEFRKIYKDGEKILILDEESEDDENLGEFFELPTYQEPENETLQEEFEENEEETSSDNEGYESDDTIPMTEEEIQEMIEEVPERILSDYMQSIVKYKEEVERTREKDPLEFSKDKLEGRYFYPEGEYLIGDSLSLLTEQQKEAFDNKNEISAKDGEYYLPANIDTEKSVLVKVEGKLRVLASLEHNEGADVNVFSKDKELSGRSLVDSNEIIFAPIEVYKREEDLNNLVLLYISEPFTLIKKEIKGKFPQTIIRYYLVGKDGNVFYFMDM